MKAIVCDKCGSVILLEDGPPAYPAGIYRLTGGDTALNLDLCENCAAELVDACRKVKGGDSNG